MIYHYFGSKEQLFQTVVEMAYVDIRSAEQKLDLESLPPVDALVRFVRFTWDYYLKNPEFLNSRKQRKFAPGAPFEKFSGDCRNKPPAC